MNNFYYIYLAIVLLCLVLSVIYKQNYRSRIWFYFAVVLLVDAYMLWFFPITKINIHPIAIVFYILFFINYYKIISSKIKGYHYLSLFVLIISGYILYTSKEIYDLRLILLMAVNYIILPLIWLYNQVIKVDENPITSKQAFWVSISLLVWIIFFIFKMVPLYFFDLNDKEFLFTVDKIFQIFNIVSYLLLLRSLFCKI